VKYSEILTEAAIPAISPQEAKDRGMFGPVYHGTEGDINQITSTGFNPKYSVPMSIDPISGRPVETAHGYSMDQYAHGLPPPIHHLGYGSYFTTVKSIAIQYNGGTTKGLKTFYIDTKNILEINFGAPNTMMKWWREHGYTMSPEAVKKRDVKAWIKATGILTRNLRQEYDAVWYKGKGIRKLLDGDQICVYNSKLIYIIDPKLASGLEIGAKVTHTGVNSRRDRNDIYMDDLQPNDFGNAGKLAGSGWKGIFKATDANGNDVPRSGTNVGNYPMHMIPPPGMIGTIVDKQKIKPEFAQYHGNSPYLYTVKWNKGGVMHNYREDELQPVMSKA